MKRKSVVIADQDEIYRTYLKTCLREYPTFFVVAECSNGSEAVRSINTLEPDLVFMETELPGKDGFSVLQETEHLPRVIFSNSNESYAYQAFENNAVDYLVKPCSTERFSLAMKKFAQLNTSQLTNTALKSAFNSYILLESGKRLKRVCLSHIIYLKAERDYTSVYTLDDETYLCSCGIGYMEHQLDPQRFLRIHRSYIINTDHLKEFNREMGKMSALLHNGTELHVGRNYLQPIKELIL